MRVLMIYTKRLDFVANPEDYRLLRDIILQPRQNGIYRLQPLGV
jgi:hypothetical protein